MSCGGCDCRSPRRRSGWCSHLTDIDGNTVTTSWAAPNISSVFGFDSEIVCDAIREMHTGTGNLLICTYGCPIDYLAAARCGADTVLVFDNS